MAFAGVMDGLVLTVQNGTVIPPRHVFILPIPPHHLQPLPRVIEQERHAPIIRMRRRAYAALE